MQSTSQLKANNAQFELYLKSSDYSKHSIQTYLFHINKLRALYDIDTFSYQEVIKVISDPSFSLRYRQVMVAALKQYYYFLMWNGTRNAHPCPNLKIRSNFGKNYLQQDFLSGEELQLLRSREQRYQHLDLRDKALLSLLTIQALSLSELARIDVAHVNTQTGRLYVPGSRKYKRRALNLLKEQRVLLDQYIEEVRPKLLKKPTQALIIGMTGGRISTDSIHYLISTLKDVIPDKKITPSMIRQSVISWWINDLKIPLEQAQLMSGHRWISSTQKYEFRKMEDDLSLVNKWQ